MTQRIDSGPDAMRQLAILNRIARIAVEDMALRPMLQRVVDTLAEEFHWEFVACAGIDAANGEFVCEAMRSTLSGNARSPGGPSTSTTSATIPTSSTRCMARVPNCACQSCTGAKCSRY